MTHMRFPMEIPSDQHASLPRWKEKARSRFFFSNSDAFFHVFFPLFRRSDSFCDSDLAAGLQAAGSLPATACMDRHVGTVT